MLLTALNLVLVIDIKMFGGLNGPLIKMVCFKFLEIVLNTVKWDKIANVILIFYYFKKFL